MYVIMVPFTTYPTNSHPDCQRIKMHLVKGLGIEEFELWKCPKQYRHLLHDERRQELNKQTIV